MVQSVAAASFLLLAGMLTASEAAPAQNGGAVIPSMSTCRTIKDSANRLKCYDNIPLTIPGREGASLPASEDKVVMKWNSSTQMQTRPFHVDGPWELQWTTAQGYFSATLHRMSGPGPKAALLANGMEAGGSSSYQPTGGDFYVEFGAMQPWTARVVTVAGPDAANAPRADQEPLLNVSGDQSNLPPCNEADAPDRFKKLVENSPLGQTIHIAVLHVGTITSRPIRDGMAICAVEMMTNGGEMSYDFQFYRKDGDVYIYGKPHEE
jgi:hypothetical protein